MARRRTRLTSSLLCAVAVMGLAPVPEVGAGSPGPEGYGIVATVGPGIEHQTLHQADPPLDVHVARLAPGLGGRLLPVLADDALANPSSGLETTSSMCARVQCLAAVNGDFFDGTGRPVGAVVAGGELVASPGVDHIILAVDGQGTPHLRRRLPWGAGLTTANGGNVRVQAVNRVVAGEGITLFSGRWGSSTRADPGAVELVLQLLTTGAFLPTGLSPVRVVGVHTGGDAPIPPGHVALSGTGAAGQALAGVAQSAAGGFALLDVNVGGIVSAIGGSPQLLLDGQLAYPAGRTDSYIQGRRSRTMVGITADLGILLVTVDHSATSSGVTLLEAAELMTALGAVHAVNLDGGGSTSFATAGGRQNVPSGGGERAVAPAVAVAPAPPARTEPITALRDEVVRALAGLPAPAD